MKKQFFAASAFAFLISFGSFGQQMGRVKFEDLRKPLIFRISPFHFFDRSLQIQTEFFDTKDYKKSFQLSVTGTYRDDNRISDLGFSMELQGRYYPRKFSVDSLPWVRNKAFGLYFGYGVQFGFNEYEISDFSQNPFQDNLKINSRWATPFFCFGYQLIVGEALYIDFYLGGGLKFNNVEYEYNDASMNFEQYNEPSIFDRAYKGIIPKVGFTVGIGL